MAKTADELRQEIQEYLDLRIRSKRPDDRTKREDLILSGLEAMDEELLIQEEVKVRQAESALESIVNESDIRISDLLRIATERKKMMRGLGKGR